MKTFTTTMALLSAVGTALGHATFQQLWVGSKDQGSTCARLPLSNSPVTSVSSNDLRCNVGGAWGVSGVCEVPAGSKVSVEMHEQPSDRACGRPAIGGNHFGPVMVYLSKVSDAKTADGSSSFFKIGEYGYTVADKTWGTDVLNANCGKFEVTIPAGLTAGDYLLRAEAIALHTASQPGGAQFYMTCYQIRVSGGGSASPAGVKFPGAYKASDPGIQVNIWGNGFTQYTIPGPAVASA
ncbi:putative endo-beta-1,4-glucanase D [Colletotrichum orbiculare MAFF 240422]|uniref:lytic cellulose monooxygenase (C4-dehydrogenating) n=1 Tax=Colletotrichum orbiculare (strain 104-T / ATCC 96160 / CBS 514.97 / LARS 414 / MAFF 240422) TaxID=1213857 RepID=N4VIC1_COLOR|nr:putative endo-beta-1,4-glucanase D [Colletotrichum orbiculare MAFF 240422]